MKPSNNSIIKIKNSPNFNIAIFYFEINFELKLIYPKKYNFSKSGSLNDLFTGF